MSCLRDERFEVMCENVQFAKEVVAMNSNIGYNQAPIVRSANLCKTNKHGREPVKMRLMHVNP